MRLIRYARFRDELRMYFLLFQRSHFVLVFTVCSLQLIYKLDQDVPYA